MNTLSITTSGVYFAINRFSYLLLEIDINPTRVYSLYGDGLWAITTCFCHYPSVSL